MRVAHRNARITGSMAYSNFWQILANDFLMKSPRKGKVRIARVYIGDLNGGPSGLEPTDSALISIEVVAPRVLFFAISDAVRT